MSLLSSLFADSINDVSSTRKVYLLAAGLALLGIVLIVVTVMFWRSSRHDPELLAPLEAMGKRNFRDLDPKSQQSVLNSARPADAQPMNWGVVRGDVSPQAEVDLEENRRNAPEGYDDLREPEPVEAIVAATAVAEVAEEPEPADDQLPAHVDEQVSDAEVVAPADDEIPVAAVEEREVAPDLVEIPAEVAPAEALVADSDGEAAPHGAFAAEAAAEEEKRPAAAPANSDGGLVIVPLDHDLVASADAPEPEPAPASDPEPVPAPDDGGVRPRPSIDPLLRMLDRNDN